MNITNEQLRQIITEELAAVLDEKKGKKQKAAKKKRRKKKKAKKATKKDACYHKVRSRYDVWPSAYASGALVKCRKVGAKNWGNKTNEELEKGGYSDELHGTMEEMHQQIADKHGVSLEKIDKQIEMGIEEETKEHGEKKAHEIAMEHVYENPEYYTKLRKAGIDEDIKKVGDEYAVYPKSGGKRLGTHSTKKKAQKQLAAIEISKAKRAKK
jgi:hypothetical protein